MLRVCELGSGVFQVSGLEMRKWMDELFPIIMDMLQDSSSLAKRQVCSPYPCP